MSESSKTKCEGCKFWSEMVAHAIGNEPVKAMCLNEHGPHYGKMVHKGCDKKALGQAVDDPEYNPPEDTAMPAELREALGFKDKDEDKSIEVEVQQPQNRPFTRLAAEMIGGDALKNLDAGKCPTCGNPVGEFRNAISRKEFGISGLCQLCQDKVFGAD